jgi:hypothetical protein
MVRHCENNGGVATAGTCTAFNSGARQGAGKHTTARELAVYSDVRVLGKFTHGLRELDPLGFHVYGINGLAGRHEQPIPFCPAEA